MELRPCLYVCTSFFLTAPLDQEVKSAVAITTAVVYPALCLLELLLSESSSLARSSPLGMHGCCASVAVSQSPFHSEGVESLEWRVLHYAVLL